MAYSTINKHTDYFNANIYTGTGSSKTISGINFAPDMVWTKARAGTSSGSHAIVDQVRGGTKKIFPDLNNAETTDAAAITSFTSDGYVMGSSGSFNTNTYTYVNWVFRAGGGTGSANTDGTINSTVSVNQTSGFSIVKYTGNGSAGATIGHGLGAVPDVIIVKKLSGTSDWSSYHSVLGNTRYMRFNNSNPATTASTYWNNTTPTSTVFTAGTTGNINGNGADYVAYCYAAKEGYSKFGSYIGNGNADGTFVYTGFKPAFVMWKRYEDSGYDWDMYDTTRDTHNVAFKELITNSAGAESTSTVLSLDILSNGFKLRTSNGNGNDNNKPYIYLAFGQTLVGSNNVSATAR